MTSCPDVPLPYYTAAESEEAEKYKHQRHTIFSNPGPNYFGEQDDEDEDLLKAEREAEEEGVCILRIRYKVERV